MLASIISVLGGLTLTEWGSWTAIGAFIIAFLLAVPIFINWLFRKVLLHKLYEAHNCIGEDYTEVEEITLNYAMPLDNPLNTQLVKLRLTLKANVNLGFINLNIKGNGNRPQLCYVDDWNLGVQNWDWRYFHRKDDSWNITMIGQPGRYRGQHLYLGITIITTGIFSGDLDIYLSCLDGVKRHRYLPIKVMENGYAEVKATKDINKS